MNLYLKRFEHIIIAALIVMMVIIVLLSTIELGWLILKDIFSPPYVLLDINELLDIFGFFLLVLIGVELLETIKAYFVEHVVHVEVVVEVAMIAIARKVIILDVKEYEPMQLFGIAVIIAALSIAHYVIKYTHRTRTVQNKE
ncbi:phosphate-starvation-inducible PsiE family protein [candidate division KSB1 bacterium]|nr:phosphate-starvation-inducible PsiE family protein [candidate division KSB1 bacterium]